MFRVETVELPRCKVKNNLEDNKMPEPKLITRTEKPGNFAVCAVARSKAQEQARSQIRFRNFCHYSEPGLCQNDFFGTASFSRFSSVQGCPPVQPHPGIRFRLWIIYRLSTGCTGVHPYTQLRQRHTRLFYLCLNIRSTPRMTCYDTPFFPGNTEKFLTFALCEKRKCQR